MWMGSRMAMPRAQLWTWFTNSSGRMRLFLFLFFYFLFYCSDRSVEIKYLKFIHACMHINIFGLEAYEGDLTITMANIYRLCWHHQFFLPIPSTCIEFRLNSQFCFFFFIYFFLLFFILYFSSRLFCASLLPFVLLLLLLAQQFLSRSYSKKETSINNTCENI